MNTMAAKILQQLPIRCCLQAVCYFVLVTDNGFKHAASASLHEVFLSSTCLANRAVISMKPLIFSQNYLEQLAGCPIKQCFCIKFYESLLFYLIRNFWLNFF